MKQVIAMMETLLKTFIAAVLGAIIASGISPLNMGKGDWKAIAGAGIAAVIVFAYNFLNPTDTRYGVGAV